jgi:hypothetical protein
MVGMSGSQGAGAPEAYRSPAAHMPQAITRKVDADTD